MECNDEDEREENERPQAIKADFRGQGLLWWQADVNRQSRLDEGPLAVLDRGRRVGGVL